ncbi:MAG: energy transducer TonB [Spirochaetota bacterium]|nr:energy transducer TonB [Spirochaetota bacterium]
MERAEIRFDLVLLVSFFMHTIVIVSFLIAQIRYGAFAKQQADSLFKGRDIIVNINQDDVKDINKNTLLSDKTSKAKGYITKEKGDRWLNNSLDFKMQKGVRQLGKGGIASSTAAKDKIMVAQENTEYSITFFKEEAGGVPEFEGDNEFTRIPDKYSITPKNALFFTSDGFFSFNTVKFKPFEYFKNMKDKVAANWHPPLLANAVIYGYNPMTGSMAPGRMRIMAVPTQDVKLYFTMDREGNVLDIVLVDSLGNKAIDESCIDAIRLSKNFGKVPDEIKGKVIVIPFLFRIVSQ